MPHGRRIPLSLSTAAASKYRHRPPVFEEPRGALQPPVGVRACKRVWSIRKGHVDIAGQYDDGIGAFRRYRVLRIPDLERPRQQPCKRIQRKQKNSERARRLKPGTPVFRAAPPANDIIYTEQKQQRKGRLKVRHERKVYPIGFCDSSMPDRAGPSFWARVPPITIG